MGLTMLGSGSVLGIFYNQAQQLDNVLVGFLPANKQQFKTLVTGDVHLNLKIHWDKGRTF